MVQPTEPWQGLNLAFSPGADRYWPTCWRVLLEPQVRSILVVVGHVLRHQPFEMPLIQDDHVVKQVSSATPNPALSNTVLPRTAKKQCVLGGFPFPSPPTPHRDQILNRDRTTGTRARVHTATLPATAAQSRERWDFVSRYNTESFAGRGP